MCCSGSTGFKGAPRRLARAAGLALAVAGALAAPRARAQAEPAGQQYAVPTCAACPAPHVPERCVELDARQSVDSAAGPLTYRWRMGDGTTLTGFVVSHCYAQQRRYTVQLDVLVNATGELRRAEKTLAVDFSQDPVLDFTQSQDTVRMGDEVAFDAPLAHCPPCTNEQIAWDFRDGEVAGGRHTSHRFRKPGLFEVRMSVRGYGLDPSCPESHCVSRAVLVLPGPGTRPAQPTYSSVPRKISSATEK